MRPRIVAFAMLLLTVRASAADQPNIVFMLSDDQSWHGTSVAMHPELEFSKSSIVQTPLLEKLASQGMRFSAAYAPASVCSPTRCSLQLGMSPARTGWTKAAPTTTAADGFRLIPPTISRNLDQRTTTIAEVLKRAGYATAHYGKWHLNGGGPSQHGYDHDDGNNNNEYAFRFRDPNPVDIFGMARRASEFMKKSQRAQKPFFIQLSWHALHAPENASQRTKDKYAKLQQYSRHRIPGTAAITEDLDTGVGMVMDAIDRMGLTSTTYVIYMSDNGGGGRRSQLRGGKGAVYEGGIRSPMIVRGPGVAANSWCHTRVVGYDWFPTFCEWAGLKKNQMPKQLDGGSLVSLLKNRGIGRVKRPREELVFHFPHYQSDDGPQSAIILGDMKLMRFYEDERVALFDLSKDIQEQTDLSFEKPEVADKLYRLLNQHLVDLRAKMPMPNPNFDPNNAPSLRQPGPERNGKRSRDRDANRRPRRLDPNSIPRDDSGLRGP